MKNNAEVTKDQAAKDQTPKTQPQAPRTRRPRRRHRRRKREPAAKASKAVKVENDAEPADRLPTTVEELKESKSGLVSFLFLSGKEKQDIAKELKTAFKLTDGAGSEDRPAHHWPGRGSSSAPSH